MQASPPRLKVFTYVTAERAELYRELMRAFIRARERFELHLRPADLLEALREAGAPLPEEPVLTAALEQLCEWGNLDAHPDTADVATVEDFYRRRFLYQITPAGEAAERAVAHFEQTLGRPGELQAAALDDIRTLLGELEQLAAAATPDGAKTHRVLDTLCARFEELTVQAQRFMSSLQRAIDLRGLALEQFVQYKHLLISYLERFIFELVAASADITARLERIEAGGVARLLACAAERELADVFDRGAEHEERARARWAGRWSGLRSWFLGRPGHPPQSEELRARARSACTALVAALAGIHDRRVQRSDRSADFRTLARWFAQAGSDAQAHRLWRAAFALGPARHLFIDDETLAWREAHEEPSHTPWLEARPIAISPRFRATGSHGRRGVPPPLVSRATEKALLVASAREEAESLAAARRLLATGRRLRLSELAAMDEPAFELFLDLLGEALSSRVDPRESVETTSSDGSLRITLEPTGDGAAASLRTSLGTLTGPDHYVTISDALASDGRFPEAAE
jgi:uncharacterized protein (TIGR02677 family)